MFFYNEPDENGGAILGGGELPDYTDPDGWERFYYQSFDTEQYNADNYLTFTNVSSNVILDPYTGYGVTGTGRRLTGTNFKVDVEKPSVKSITSDKAISVRCKMRFPTSSNGYFAGIMAKSKGANSKNGYGLGFYKVGTANSFYGSFSMDEPAFGSYTVFDYVGTNINTITWVVLRMDVTPIKDGSGNVIQDKVDFWEFRNDGSVPWSGTWGSPQATKTYNVGTTHFKPWGDATNAYVGIASSAESQMDVDDLEVYTKNA